MHKITSIFLLLLSVIGYSQQQLQIEISSQDNDIEIRSNNSIDTGSSDLELHGRDGSTPQETFLRFESVNLPSDAVISNVYLTVYGDENSSSASTITIYGEIGSAMAYTNTTGQSIKSRNYSNSTVNWNTSYCVVNQAYNSPNLKNILAEMFPQGLNGENIAFRLKGNEQGEFTVHSYSYSSMRPRLTIEYTSQTGTITAEVAQSNNDAEQYLTNGNITLGDGTLELGGRNGSTPQVTGIRFANVNIPSDAQITDAYIEFYSYGNNPNNAELTFRTELGNPNSYTSSNSNITSRTYTVRKVKWETTAWTSSNTKYRSANLKEIIDENRIKGWLPGQFLAFKIEGNDGEARAWSVNGSATYQPRLIIEYLNNGQGPSVGPEPIDETIRTYVSSNNNDAEENLFNGNISLNDGTLELGGKNGYTSQITGIRFENVNIPANAQITDAYIEFYSYGGSQNNAELTFKSELGNPTAYTSANSNISARNYSVRRVTWQTQPWTSGQLKSRTSNLKEIIDENRLGTWQSGQSLAFKIEGNEGDARAWSVNGSTTYQPRLVIEYLNNGQGPSVGPAPLDETTSEYITEYNNDAEENLDNGNINLGDGILELGGFEGSTPYTTALRFENIQLPENAQIEDAYIEFYAYGTNSANAQVSIVAENTTNPAIYSSSSKNITDRNYTTYFVDWNTSTWDNYEKVRTPNLKHIINQVRLTNWQKGNAMAFKFESESGNARVHSRNSSEYYQPRLVIKYLNNGQGPDQTISEEITKTQVTNNDNDAEQRLRYGNMSLNDGLLELGGGNGGSVQISGLRFENIQIPESAEIIDAYLEFFSYGGNSNNAELSIRTELGNPSIYTNTNNDILDRYYTEREINWTTTPWNSNRVKHRSPNLKEIIDENRLGTWQPGQSLAFKIEGNGGYANANSANASNYYQPKLVIKYINNGNGASVESLPASNTEEVFVQNYNNDAEEYIRNGNITLGDGVLELGGRNGSTEQVTAIRFEGVQIPENAQITDAYIEFYSYGGNNNNAKLTIKTELGSSSIYTNTNNNILSRKYSLRRVEWTTAPWTSGQVQYRTPNLQEIIDENRLDGWKSGEGLSFKIEGDNGYANAWSVNGNYNYQPKLVVKYLNNGQGPSVGQAPINETIREYVTNYNNDAEQYLQNGNITLGDGVLELGGRNGSTPQITAIRFENIDLPNDAQISDAYIEFYSYGNNNAGSQIKVFAESNDAPVYSNANGDISNREYSDFFADWNTTGWTSNTKVRTPNLQNVIDQIRLSGWNAGNALAFMFESESGGARVFSRNGSEAYQPRLVIEYLNNGVGPVIEGIEMDPANMTKIYINELSSQGTDSQEYDWIELYNDHDYPIYIKNENSGIYVSDKDANRTLSELKNVYIPAKGFSTIVAYDDPSEGSNYFNFGLSSKGETVYLSRKVNETVIEQDTATFGSMVFGQTVGRYPDGTGNLVYFVESTYKKSNTLGQQLIDPSFSHERGVYPSGFNLSISAPTGSTIKYTLDGRIPSQTNGTTYTAPISINKTSVVRTYIYNPTGNSGVLTHTYILKNNYVNESGAGYGEWNYKSNINPNEYAQAISQIPIVSVSGGSEPSSGWREYYVEYLDNHVYSDRENFISNSVAKRFGQASAGNRDLNLKLKFNSDAGVSKAEYPFFDVHPDDAYEMPEKIQTLELKEGQDGPSLNQYSLGFMQFSEKVSMDLQKQMGKYALETRYVHLLIDGKYRGVKTLRNDYKEQNVEEVFGGSDDDYTKVNLQDGYFTNGLVESGDGEQSVWNNIRNVANSGDFQTFKNLVDIEDLIKFQIAFMFLDTENEATAIMHNTDNTIMKAMFTINDTDGAFFGGNNGSSSSVEMPPRAINGGGNYKYKWNYANSRRGPGGLFGEFMGSNNSTTTGNLEFKTLVKDAVLENIGPASGNFTGAEGAPLSVANVQQEITKNVNELDLLYKLDASYLAFNANVYQYWKNVDYPRILAQVPERVQYSLNKWLEYNMAHTLNPANIIADNIITENDNVVINNPNSGTQLYYTLNGTDPMGNNGVVSTEAILYTGVFKLTVGQYNIVTRAFTTNNWGPKSNKHIEVEDPNAGKFVISGINYNPQSNSDAEFILITNAGNSDLDVSDYTIDDAIVYTFPQNTTIAQGTTIMLVKDLALISGFDTYTKYQWTSGGLKNSSETITFKDSAGNNVDYVTYTDIAPWPTEADGSGYYLSLISTDLDNALAESWEAVVESSFAKTEGQQQSRNKEEQSPFFAQQLKLYPNPVKDYLYIETSEKVTVYIYNLLGSLVESKSLSSGNNKINMTSLQGGTYIIKIQSGKYVKTYKILKN